MGTLREEIEKGNPQIEIISKQLSEAIKRHFEPIQKSLEGFRDVFSRFAERLPDSLKTLSDYGWYISGNSPITDSIELAKELKSGRIDKVDKHLIDFYEGEFNDTIERVLKSYPERSKIVNEAKAAHRKGMYFASTSLFLSTADGILGGKLFMIRGEKQPLKTFLKSSGHLVSFSEVITQVSAIDAFWGGDEKYPSSFNRHGVMHGYDYDYGIKINSLKALSLLAFVTDLIDIKNHV